MADYLLPVVYDEKKYEHEQWAI